MTRGSSGLIIHRGGGGSGDGGRRDGCNYGEGQSITMDDGTKRGGLAGAREVMACNTVREMGLGSSGAASKAAESQLGLDVVGGRPQLPFDKFGKPRLVVSWLFFHFILYFCRDNSMCGILPIKMVLSRLLKMTSMTPLPFMFVHFEGRPDKAFLLC
jgi:hypothetical protein